jgi:hypothetical protein
MSLKLKTLAFAAILTFSCPLVAHELLDCNMNSGHTKHVKKYQIKDKRYACKSQSNFAKNKNRINDAEFVIEYHQAVNSSIDFLYDFSASPEFIPPITKYAVWSKSTYY